MLSLACHNGINNENILFEFCIQIVIRLDNIVVVLTRFCGRFCTYFYKLSTNFQDDPPMSVSLGIKTIYSIKRKPVICVTR